MALPPAAPDREFKHRRSIDVRVYARGNGLWEVDASLTDVRPEAFELQAGTRPAGEPIHDMLLRLVIDEQFNILEAGAVSVRVPYPGHCDTFGDIYERLVGLNLMRGFRREVAARLGGVIGCTHLTELSQVLPTAVVQAFAGNVFDTGGTAAEASQPFQIDRCRALRSSGDAVRTYYPRWYRPRTDPAPAEP
jgi:hypothetical protein